MRKKTPAQIEAAEIKARLTEMLTYQIEKLVKSTNFECDELFEIFHDAIKVRGSNISASEFLAECNKVSLDGMAYLVPDVDMVQDRELADFCKEKGIKLLAQWDV
jgi:tryptophan synthase alpha subunit